MLHFLIHRRQRWRKRREGGGGRGPGGQQQTLFVPFEELNTSFAARLKPLLPSGKFTQIREWRTDATRTEEHSHRIAKLQCPLKICVLAGQAHPLKTRSINGGGDTTCCITDSVCETQRHSGPVSSRGWGTHPYHNVSTLTARWRAAREPTEQFPG